MTAIIDYGVGNLFSLESSFAFIHQEVVVTSDRQTIRNADRIILPGVGAFGDAAAKLAASGLDRVIIEEAAAGKPLMGICLGMQLLFEKSYEYGCHKGLGLIPGEIRSIGEVIPAELKIPHIGWNALYLSSPCSPLFTHIHDRDCVYFVHSFQAVTPDENVTAKSEYGAMLTAAVQNGNVFGCQFHPEKSGKVGLEILKAFCEMEVSSC